MEQTYEDAVKLLTSQEKFHICLGLERISQILEFLGNPQDKLKCIHVAGTNGKGSVSAILSTILTEAGYKTGLFTSPHILEYTERIKINNSQIPHKDFARGVYEICETAKKNNIYLTEFEILTAVMFKYFADNEIDICVLETGLGGRFDATNVIKENLCSVITSVSFDHTDRLGDTIEKIAFEKAGIIKENCPVIINPNNAGYRIILEQSEIKKSMLKETRTFVDLKFEKGVNYAVFEGKNYEFGLLGLYQKDNLELVLEVLKNLKGFNICPAAIGHWLKNVKWPCRLQYIKEKNLLIDGAHNPDGAKRLRESLDFYFSGQKIKWIYGSLANKDYETALKTLVHSRDDVYLYDFHHPNHASFETLNKILGGHARRAGVKDIPEILAEEGLTVIAGSIYMIGEIVNSVTDFKNIA